MFRAVPQNTKIAPDNVSIPSWHMVPKWRRIDVDSTWSRRIDVMCPLWSNQNDTVPVEMHTQLHLALATQ